jgi:hypothetical protein
MSEDIGEAVFVYTKTHLARSSKDGKNPSITHFIQFFLDFPQSSSSFLDNP